MAQRLDQEARRYRAEYPRQQIRRLGENFHAKERLILRRRKIHPRPADKRQQYEAENAVDGDDPDRKYINRISHIGYYTKTTVKYMCPRLVVRLRAQCSW